MRTMGSASPSAQALLHPFTPVTRFHSPSLSPDRHHHHHVVDPSHQRAGAPRGPSSRPLAHRLPRVQHGPLPRPGAGPGVVAVHLPRRQAAHDDGHEHQDVDNQDFDDGDGDDNDGHDDDGRHGRDGAVADDDDVGDDDDHSRRRLHLHPRPGPHLPRTLCCAVPITGIKRLRLRCGGGRGGGLDSMDLLLSSPWARVTGLLVRVQS